MSRSLREELAAFSAGDASVRAVSGLLGILPFAASWSPVLSLDDAAAAIDPTLGPRIATRAEALAQAEGPQAALAAFAFLDKGDTGIALFSGLRGAYKGVKGEAGALEMDPQQAADAGLKAIGIAWAGWKLFPGGATERAGALAGTAAGRALLTWYVAADLVLPFADNLASGGADALTRLIDEQAAANAERLAAVAGPEAIEATGVLRGLLAGIRSGLGQAATYATPLSQWVQSHLPGALAKADALTGVVATAVDTLACYRLVGASLVAEVCLAQAAQEVRAEVAAEAAAEAARKAAEEAARVAEAQRRVAEEQARRAAGRQKEDYTLDEAVDAASLKNAPIRVTRGADVAPSEAAPPARAGCMGCGGLLLVGLLLGAVAAAPFVA